MGKKFPKKSRSAEKGGPFGLARYGMLRGKTGRTFLVQFARPNGAMIFCRTFNNYFGQFVWIEKKTSRDRPKSAPYPRLKNSKKTSKCQVLFYSTRKSKFFEKNFFEKITYSKKNGPSGAPGLASASPWRAKVSQCRKTERVDPLRFFNIHSVAKHEKIEENKNFHFREKISQCRKKTERGDPLGFFSIHSVAKHEKIEENKNFHFREKISQCRKKTERGDPLGFFRIHSVAKHQKNAGGDPLGKIFFSKKKSRSAEKNERVFGLARYGMLRGKTGKTFLVQFARPNSAF